MLKQAIFHLQHICIVMEYDYGTVCSRWPWAMVTWCPLHLYCRGENWLLMSMPWSSWAPGSFLPRSGGALPFEQNQPIGMPCCSTCNELTPTNHQLSVPNLRTYPPPPVQEALKRPMKQKRKLRVFISNTFFPAKSPGEGVGAEPGSAACWELRVEGKLLSDDAKTDAAKVGNRMVCEIQSCQRTERYASCDYFSHDCGIVTFTGLRMIRT